MYRVPAKCSAIFAPWVHHAARRTSETTNSCSMALGVLVRPPRRGHSRVPNSFGLSAYRAYRAFVRMSDRASLISCAVEKRSVRYGAQAFRRNPARSPSRSARTVRGSMTDSPTIGLDPG
jgi:hypothetical protein